MSEYVARNPTHIIYRIFNASDGKSYIGRTLNFERRVLEHFLDLGKNAHHSTKLQAAYNELGVDCFEVEIIEADVPNEDATILEMYWIAYFASYTSGYNMTPGGEFPPVPSNSKPFVWNDIEYASISSAARALGVSRETITSRAKKGYTANQQLPNQPRKKIEYRVKPCVWNGVEYPSIAAAMRATGIRRETLSAHLKQGYKADCDLPRVRNEAIHSTESETGLIARLRNLRTECEALAESGSFVQAEHLVQQIQSIEKELGYAIPDATASRPTQTRPTRRSRAPRLAP